MYPKCVWLLTVFAKKSYMSSWVFTAMQSVHIRMNSSLNPPLKKILDPPMTMTKVYGLWSPGDARGNSLIVCLITNSGIEECEKCTHLKHLKSSIDKKTRFEKLKIFQRIFSVSNVLVFNNFFYSVGLTHKFISEILLVMGMHWGCKLHFCMQISIRQAYQKIGLVRQKLLRILFSKDKGRSNSFYELRPGA